MTDTLIFCVGMAIAVGAGSIGGWPTFTAVAGITTFLLIQRLVD